MGPHANNRRALLRTRGRPMVLRRQVGTAAAQVVSLTGFARAFLPGELLGGVQQGDVRIDTLNDEIAAAAWPAPPRNPDRIVLDLRTYTVMGAWPVMEGVDCIGWQLWCRGG